MRVAPLLLAACLAGCGGRHDTGEVLASGGDVLPGSVSDAMLPYDALKSKAPPMPPVASDRPAFDRGARDPGAEPGDGSAAPPPTGSAPLAPAQEPEPARSSAAAPPD